MIKITEKDITVLEKTKKTLQGFILFIKNVDSNSSIIFELEVVLREFDATIDKLKEL